MTREEAINKLVNARYADEFQGDEELTTAHLMAIKALSQEPCDVVSRQAVEEIINDIRDCISVEGYWAILERLKKLQSVRPQLNEQAAEWYKLFVEKFDSCDDVVSREDTLKLIYDFKEKHTEDREKHPINYGTLLDLIRLIRELPSVRPQEQTGHWIKNISENGITSAVRCSECGFEDNRYMLFRYCPNCGADMRGEPND